MKLFYRLDPSLIFESNHVTPPIQLDEIDELANSMEANMSKDISVPKDVLNSFQIKESLNPEIWPTDKELNPKITAKLMQIAKDFIKDLDLPQEVKISDIIFTGSLANYNWSKYSDIDLHIVLDFEQFEAEPKILEDYFYGQKAIWNEEHDISVFGYPVEIYVQDLNAELQATAVYSVMKNKWVKKPKREAFELDKSAIKDKADKFIYQLRGIRQDYRDKQYKSVVDKVKKLKERIYDMRTAGLEKGGELSLENLVFKVLRRIPFMDQLDSYKAKAYDNLMSVVERIDEGKIWEQGGVLLILGEKLEGDEQRLYVTTIKNLSELNRNKMDQTKGVPARMAVLGNQVYRLSIIDGKLKAQGVAWGTPSIMLKKLGLVKNAVSLNNNKTPLHWETLQYNNIGQALHAISGQIFKLPNIKWIG